MFDFEEKKTVIAEELEKFNAIFSTSFFVEDELLNNVLRYLSPLKGKQIRPILVILAAKICGSPTSNTYKIASAYELLHTASLVHDDVIDNAMQRRNIASLNKVFNNKTAVLAGDYLMTRSFNFIYQTGEMEQIGLLQELSMDIIRGELLQQQHSRTLLKETDYFSIIKFKTASLFATCLKSGALSAGANAERLKLMYEIGNDLGICFQIKDDIFDYSTNVNIGKPIFNDITEGKVTLPLLHAIKSSTENEKIKVINIINKEDVDINDKTYIFNLIKKYKGIEYSAEKMDFYKNRALEKLDNFERSEHKTFLSEIICFAANRNH